MPLRYRDAARILWGDAGTAAHDAYTRMRPHYPELPDQLPIVIGITAYGKCHGLTRSDWSHGPRITLASNLFARGQRFVDDTMVHEMLHAWLAVKGLDSAHDSASWYAAVRRLSPAVLGRPLDVARGTDRRSVRIPNPKFTAAGDEPKTIVRKERVASGHADAARWPGSFRAAGYYVGGPIDCPTY